MDTMQKSIYLKPDILTGSFLCCIHESYERTVVLKSTGKRSYTAKLTEAKFNSDLRNEGNLIIQNRVVQRNGIQHFNTTQHINTTRTVSGHCSQLSDLIHFYMASAAHEVPGVRSSNRSWDLFDTLCG